MPRVQPDTVRGGKVARVRVRHVVEAGCLACDAAWSGSLVFVLATEHTEQTGHETVAGWLVAYAYRPAR